MPLFIFLCLTDIDMIQLSVYCQILFFLVSEFFNDLDLFPPYLFSPFLPIFARKKVKRKEKKKEFKYYFYLCEEKNK
jgi:hypothetical protein